MKFSSFRSLICCAALFLFALGLRLPYANVVVEQFNELPAADRASYEMGYLTLDSRGYEEAAMELMKGNIAPSASLIRSVGYPAFLAAMGANPRATLNAQAMLLSLIPVCTFLLVTMITGNNWFGFAAGLLSSISPSGIGLSSLIMSDSLFACLFAVLFTALVYGTLRNSMPWILFSAIVSGIAILVRPILLFWPVIAVVVSALIAGFPDGVGNSPRRWFRMDKHRLRHGLVLFFIPTFFVLSWAEVNYVKNGIFTVSIVGDMALRKCLAARTEEWGIAGHLPSSAAIRQNQKALKKRINALTVQARARLYLHESIAIIRKYPVPAVKAFARNALENAVCGWNYFPRQLPLSQDRFGKILSRISFWESWLRRIALPLVLFAPSIGLVAIRRSRSPGERRLVSTLFAMTLIFLCFITVSGVALWAGPRLLYPVEFLQISTLAALGVLLMSTIGRGPSVI